VVGSAAGGAEPERGRVDQRVADDGGHGELHGAGDGANGLANTKPLSIEVLVEGGPVPGAPTITTETLPATSVGASYERPA
jgi:hypothetical protein